MTELEQISRNEIQRVSKSHHELPEDIVSDHYKDWKVLGLVADDSACGYYRVVLPLQMLKRMGADVLFSTQQSMDTFFNYDIIIVPRQQSLEILEVMHTASWEGKLFVYEIDDDLDHLDPSNPAFGAYHKGSEELRNIPKLMKVCHGMTVTTPELAKWYYQHNQNMGLIPNFIDFSMRDWNVDVAWDGINPVFDPKPIKYFSEDDGIIRILFSGGSCFTPDHEILTENGWKKFTDLDHTEKVATLNPNTQEIEYHKPYNYINQPYKGEIHTVENRYAKYSVTPNHQIFCATHKMVDKVIDTKDTLKYELKSSEDVIGTGFYLSKLGTWKGREVSTFTIPGDNLHKDVVWEMDDWLKFFGFWCGDGWTTGTKSDSTLKQVGLAQKKSEEPLKEIEIILNKYGYKPYYTKTKTQLRVFNSPLWSYLHQFGNATTKYLPKEIKELCPRQLKIWLEGYMMADGHKEKNTKGRLYNLPRLRIWTVSRQLADDVTEVALKLGWSSNCTNRGIRTSKMKDGRIITGKNDCYQVGLLHCSGEKSQGKPYVATKNQFIEQYEGTVHCVSVQNHIIYVRKDGVPHWSGNSHAIDLAEALHDVRTILLKYPNTRFCFYGPETSLSEIVHQYRLPQDRLDYITSRHFLDYPGPLFGHDISIAPLHSSQFNLAKSPLRCLEMGAAGIATVASCFGPYARYAASNPGCLSLVGANCQHQTFADALSYLITNEKARKALQETSRNTVINKYSLEKNVHIWPSTWNEIVKRRNAGIIGPPPKIGPTTEYMSYKSIQRNEIDPLSGQKYKKSPFYGWTG